MDVGDLVRGHYSRAELEQVILSALVDAGVETETLTARDLAPVDELHAGGLPALRYLLAQLQLTPVSRLLDVGCGVGGPARIAALEYGCRVVGIDLSPDFIRTAQGLTDRVGLSGLVQHEVSAGEALRFEDDTFDRAMLVHVGMNVPDKDAVFAEVRRVLVTGGVFGLFEQMRTGLGDPNYPLPWAEDERSSFVESPQAYVAALEAAGFDVEVTENRSVATTPSGPVVRQLSPATVFGPGFAERFANNVAATRAGLVEPVLMLASAR